MESYTYPPTGATVHVVRDVERVAVVVDAVMRRRLPLGKAAAEVGVPEKTARKWVRKLKLELRPISTRASEYVHPATGRTISTYHSLRTVGIVVKRLEDGQNLRQAVRRTKVSKKAAGDWADQLGLVVTDALRPYTAEQTGRTIHTASDPADVHRVVVRYEQGLQWAAILDGVGAPLSTAQGWVQALKVKPLGRLYTSAATGKTCGITHPWGTVHRMVERYARFARWEDVLDGVPIPKPTAAQYVRKLGLTRSAAEAKRMWHAEKNGVDYAQAEADACAMRLNDQLSSAEIMRRLKVLHGYDFDGTTVRGWLAAKGVGFRPGSAAARRAIGQEARRAHRLRTGHEEPRKRRRGRPVVESQATAEDMTPDQLAAATKAAENVARTMSRRYRAPERRGEFVSLAFQNIVRYAYRWKPELSAWEDFVGFQAWQGIASARSREVRRTLAKSYVPVYSGSEKTHLAMDLASVEEDTDRVLDWAGEDDDVALQKAAALNDALAALDAEDERLAYVLRATVVDGYKQKDVAHQLGLTQGRVCQLVHLAEDRVRRHVQERRPSLYSTTA